MFVYSFRRLEGGACFLFKEFEAENFQRVDVVLSVRVEGVVKQFLTSLRGHGRTSTGEVSLWSRSRVACIKQKQIFVLEAQDDV